jgi:hypothetical protein
MELLSEHIERMEDEKYYKFCEDLGFYLKKSLDNKGYELQDFIDDVLSTIEVDHPKLEFYENYDYE